jgi:hypothetical protein
MWGMHVCNEISFSIILIKLNTTRELTIDLEPQSLLVVGGEGGPRCAPCDLH